MDHRAKSQRCQAQYLHTGKETGKQRAKNILLVILTGMCVLRIELLISLHLYNYWIVRVEVNTMFTVQEGEKRVLVAPLVLENIRHAPARVGEVDLQCVCKEAGFTLFIERVLPELRYVRDILPAAVAHFQTDPIS